VVSGASKGILANWFAKNVMAGDDRKGIVPIARCVNGRSRVHLAMVSMSEKRRARRLRNDRSRHSSENSLPHPGMAICAHDEKVGSDVN